ncbi:MAG: acyltransferase [Verrucomicrobiota bacterium]
MKVASNPQQQAWVQRPRETLHEIDTLACWGILLVVLGHSIPDMTAKGWAQLGLVKLVEVIYTFHMPLFFFISGFLFMHTHPPEAALDYRDLVRQKARRLLLPYLVISSLAFPVKALMAQYAKRPLEFTLESYLTSLAYPWLNTIIYFWFLPTLFGIFLLAPILRRLVLRTTRSIHFLTGVILAGTYWYFFDTQWTDLFNYQGVLKYPIYFWAGMLAWSMRRHLRHLGQLKFVIGFLLLLVVVWQNAPHHPAKFLALGTAGILFSFSGANYLESRGLRPFTLWSGKSYPIYLLSWFPQIFFKIVAGTFLGLSFWPTAFLMFFGGMAAPLVISSWIEKRLPRWKIVVGL